MVGLDAIAHQRRRGDAAPSDADRALQGQARRQGGHADPCGARRLSEVRRSQGRLLAQRSGAAIDERRALTATPKKPGRDPGRALNQSAEVTRGSVGSVADLDAAGTPAVAIPEAVGNPD